MRWLLMLLLLAAPATTPAELGRALTIDGQVYWVPYIPSKTAAVVLPDSIRQQLQARDWSSVTYQSPNTGWVFMDFGGETALAFPQSQACGPLWPTPDGWCLKLMIHLSDGWRIAFVRASDSTLVAPWYPSPSPSY